MGNRNNSRGPREKDLEFQSLQQVTFGDNLIQPLNREALI